MININKNTSLRELDKLFIKSFISKNNSSFENAKNIVELFQRKKFLEKTIDETISFNKKLVWDNTVKNLGITRTAEELIEIYKLRSDIYGGLNYSDEFPDYIDGLNFDSYDNNSAIIYNKINNEITGTCRLIFDSTNKLPVEKRYSFDYIREKYNLIGEVSRLMVKQKTDGLNLEFKYLTKGIYLILTNNPINISVSVIKKEHLKLYAKFGGFNVEKELKEYGTLKSPFVLTSWNPKNISNFFKKMFLR